MIIKHDEVNNQGDMMESEWVMVRREGCYLTQSSQGNPLGSNFEVRPQNNGGADPVKSPEKSARVEELAWNNVLESNRHFSKRKRMLISGGTGHCLIPYFQTFHLAHEKTKSATQSMVVPGIEPGILGTTPLLLPLHHNHHHYSPFLITYCVQLCIKHVTLFSHLHFTI